METRLYKANVLKRCLLAISFVGTAMSSWAQTTHVAKIGDTEYETLQAAIVAATDGQSVTLIADITETATYTINKTLTIDFGEYTLKASHTTSSASSNEDKVFDITSDGELTVTGTTGGVTDEKVLGIFNNAGTLTINGGHFTTKTDDYGVVYNNGGICTVAGGTLTGAYAAIYGKGTNSITINGGTIHGALGIQATAGTTLDVTGGTICATNEDKKYPALYLIGEGTVVTVSGGSISGWDGISVRDHAKLTVSEGEGSTATISGKNAAIIGNGNPDQGGTTITINGGTMTSDDTGIYHPQDGTLTINGGTISGDKLGVEIRAGELTITGGSITANATEYSCTANGNGTTTIGAALAIAQHTTKKDIAVTISGGTFTGKKAISESNPQANEPDPQVIMSVNNGTFNGGITVTDVQDGFIEGGTFTEAVPAEYCVSGKAPYVDEEGKCTIISDGDVPTDAEAAIVDGSYYKKLDAAITAAGTTETTITLLKEPAAETITIPADAKITLNVADDVTLTKTLAITNNGNITIASDAIKSAITMADAAAKAKVTVAPANTTVALSTELSDAHVLKSKKEGDDTTYWLEKKVSANVELPSEATNAQTDAAEALVANSNISTVTVLTPNQSLTITVTSVELDANSNVTKATFEVKLIDADGSEVTGTDLSEVKFRLPIKSSVVEGTWVNLWHNTNAIPGVTVQGSDANKYVIVTTTSFSPFSYEIIETPIAQIGETKYGSVNDAINATTDNQATATEIKLLEDVDAPTTITVVANKNVKLNIGNFKVSGDITNNGTLTIADGTVSGAITNENSNGDAVGTLTITDNAKITGTVSASDGTLAISGGTFSNTITTSGTAGLAITNGNINGAVTVGGSGTNTITGGNFTSTSSITNSAALTITGGIFEFTSDISNTGTVAISGGTHKALPVKDFCAQGYIPVKASSDSPYTMTNSWTIVDDTNLSINSHLIDDNGCYTVATAKYERRTGMFSAGNIKTKYGTICLPFVITEQPTGMTLYRATSINGNKLNITAVDFSNSATIAAGTPLIFELSEANSEMDVVSTDAAVDITAPSTTSGEENLLVGTYTPQTITAPLVTDCYYIYGDKFHQAIDKVEVPAYRAYIKLSGSNGAKANVLYIQTEDEEADAISPTPLDDEMEAVYDLSGRKQSGLQRGMNIMRMKNGRTIKVFVNK